MKNKLHQYLLQKNTAVLHTTKEIDVNEIGVDLGSFAWHTTKPLQTYRVPFVRLLH